jgi:hypothetical protein
MQQDGRPTHLLHLQTNLTGPHAEREEEETASSRKWAHEATVLSGAEILSKVVENWHSHLFQSLKLNIKNWVARWRIGQKPCRHQFA